jgi:hypothetical protein
MKTLKLFILSLLLISCSKEEFQAPEEKQFICKCDFVYSSMITKTTYKDGTATTEITQPRQEDYRTSDPFPVCDGTTTGEHKVEILSDNTNDGVRVMVERYTYKDNICRMEEKGS